jgi:hypothetical protein
VRFIVSTVYKGCTYEGGFQKLQPKQKLMKPGGDGRLELEQNRFSLRRPRLPFSGDTRILHAPWSKVTDLEVEEADEGTRLTITTERQGTGSIVIPDQTPDQLWQVLDDLADLKARFHDAPARDRATSEHHADGAEDGAEDEGAEADE